MDDFLIAVGIIGLIFVLTNAILAVGARDGGNREGKGQTPEPEYDPVKESGGWTKWQEGTRDKSVAAIIIVGYDAADEAEKVLVNCRDRQKGQGA